MRAAWRNQTLRLSRGKMADTVRTGGKYGGALRSDARAARRARRLTAAAVPWCAGALAVAIALACAPAGAIGGGCRLIRIGEIPVTMRGVPVVPASLDGHPVQLIVDTGAYSSLLWRPVATSLGLRRLGVPAGKISGGGGAQDAELVTVRDFGLADYRAHDLRFLMATAGLVTDAAAAVPLAGVLGEDFLAHMDVEFDLAAGKLRLFQPEGCTGDQVVYWAPAYFMVQLTTPPQGTRWLQARARLNGHDVVVMFDSGAARTTVMAAAASRAGGDAPTTALPPMHGIGPKPVAAAVTRFASLTIGQETIENATLVVADVFGANRQVPLGSYLPQAQLAEPDVIVGADFFLAHRLYIARSQGKIYFTWLGGPVFQPPPAADAPAGGAQR
jgi:predicted aspartyl protease